MKYCIVVSASPSLPSASYALNFCLALQRHGHRLYRIFFHAHGVLNGDAGQSMAQHWSELECEERLCCSASFKRFFFDANGGVERNIHPSFSVAGLGQLVEAENSCDRVVSFGENPVASEISKC